MMEGIVYKIKETYLYQVFAFCVQSDDFYAFTGCSVDDRLLLPRPCPRDVDFIFQDPPVHVHGVAPGYDERFRSNIRDLDADHHRRP